MASPLATPTKAPARSLSQLRSALQSISEQPLQEKQQVVFEVKPEEPEKPTPSETAPTQAVETEPIVITKKPAIKQPATKTALKAPSTKATVATPEKKPTAATPEKKPTAASTSALKPPTPSKIAIPQLSSATPSNLKTSGISIYKETKSDVILGIPSPTKPTTPTAKVNPKSPVKPTIPSPIKSGLPSPTASAKPSLQSPRTLTPRKL